MEDKIKSHENIFPVLYSGRLILKYSADFF